MRHFDIAISDHKVIFCTCKISKSQTNTGSHCSIRFRFKHYSLEGFEHRLSERNWADVLVERMLTRLGLCKEHFIAALNAIAPMKKI